MGVGVDVVGVVLGGCQFSPSARRIDAIERTRSRRRGSDDPGDPGDADDPGWGYGSSDPPNIGAAASVISPQPWPSPPLSKPKPTLMLVDDSELMGVVVCVCVCVGVGVSNISESSSTANRGFFLSRPLLEPA